MGMTIAGLCEAAVIYSDNTAREPFASDGQRIGRPDTLVAQSGRRSHGARQARTRAQFAGRRQGHDDARRDAGLAARHTTRNETLRGRLPKGWAIGDKTGRWTNSSAAATNDLAIVTPPLIACRY
jgi:beta-lactamase class A